MLGVYDKPISLLSNGLRSVGHVMQIKKHKNQLKKVNLFQSSTSCGFGFCNYSTEKKNGTRMKRI